MPDAFLGLAGLYPHSLHQTLPFLFPLFRFEKHPTEIDIKLLQNQLLEVLKRSESDQNILEVELFLDLLLRGF